MRYGFSAHAEQTGCLALAKGCPRLLCTGGDDKRVHLWALDNASSTQIATLSSFNSPVSAVDLDTEGRLSLAGTSTGTLKLWDLETQNIVRSFAPLGSSVAGLEFAYNAQLFSSVSEKGDLKIWDIRRRSCIVSLNHGTSGSAFPIVTFSPDASLIFATSGIKKSQMDAVSIYDLSYPQRPTTLTAFAGDPVIQIIPHPRKLELYAVQSSGAVLYWDLHDRNNVHAQRLPGFSYSCPGSRMTFLRPSSESNSDDLAIALPNKLFILNTFDKGSTEVPYTPAWESVNNSKASLPRDMPLGLCQIASITSQQVITVQADGESVNVSISQRPTEVKSAAKTRYLQAGSLCTSLDPVLLHKRPSSATEKVPSASSLPCLPPIPSAKSKPPSAQKPSSLGETSQFEKVSDELMYKLAVLPPISRTPSSGNSSDSNNTNGSLARPNSDSKISLAYSAKSKDHLEKISNSGRFLSPIKRKNPATLLKDKPEQNFYANPCSELKSAPQKLNLKALDSGKLTELGTQEPKSDVHSVVLRSLMRRVEAIRRINGFIKKGDKLQSGLARVRETMRNEAEFGTAAAGACRDIFNALAPPFQTCTSDKQEGSVQLSDKYEDEIPKKDETKGDEGKKIWRAKWLTLDACVSLLPWVAELMFFPCADYQRPACRMLKGLLDTFGYVIAGALSTHARAPGIDIKHEERVDKCKSALETIKDIKHLLAMAKINDATDPVTQNLINSVYIQVEALEAQTNT